ncbi:MAG: hypothetical protein ACLTKG_02005 [Collinsella intestinalis]
MLLNPDQRSLALELDASIETVGLDDGTPCVALQGDPEFLEVAGPHARGAAYASALADLVGDGRDVVVAAARPSEVFEEVSPRLAARGISSECALVARFGQTAVGRQFAALSDVVARMKDAGRTPSARRRGGLRRSSPIGFTRRFPAWIPIPPDVRQEDPINRS